MCSAMCVKVKHTVHTTSAWAAFAKGRHGGSLTMWQMRHFYQQTPGTRSKKPSTMELDPIAFVASNDPAVMY